MVFNVISDVCGLMSTMECVPFLVPEKQQESSGNMMPCS